MSALTGVSGPQVAPTPPVAPTATQGPRRTLCRFCCSACGRHFSSESAFDLHRQGSYRDGSRHCVDPSTVKGKGPSSTLIAKSEDGQCEIGAAVIQRGVTVWQTLAAHDSEYPA